MSIATETEAPRTTRLKQHAANYGQDVAQIALLRMQHLDELLNEGCLVDIYVGGISALSATPSWRELGIPEKDRRAKKYTRGRKYLVPDELRKPIQSAETQARYHLAAHSATVEGFAPWAWVSYKSYWGVCEIDEQTGMPILPADWSPKSNAKIGWRARQMVIEERFTEYKRRLMVNHPMIRLDIRLDYAITALEALSAYSARAKLPDDIELQDDVLFDQAMAKDFAEAEQIDALDRYCPLDHLRRRWLGDHNATKGQLEEQADYELRRYGVRHYLAALDNSGQRFVARIVQRALKALPSIETMQSTLTLSYRSGMLEDRRSVEQSLLHAKELELEREQVSADIYRLQAMKRAEYDKAKEQLSELTSPILAVIKQFEAKLFKKVTEMLEGYTEHGFFHGKQITAAQELRALFDLLPTTAMQQTSEVQA
jgi:hypothetical protein